MVEDEYLIRMLLEDMLADLGYEVAAAAGSLAEAGDLAKQTEFDLAILDVNIEDLIGTRGTGGHCVFCARPGRWGIVPQRQREAVRRDRSERGR